MASIAGGMGRERACADWRGAVSAVGLAVIGRNGPVRAGGETAVITALAASGLAALIALPFLILASLALDAPFAVPAAIALGYLGIAHATALRSAGRAAAWSVAVFAGLAGWALFFTLIGGEPRSGSGFAALLMAPLFAAAPALARSVLMTRPAPGPALQPAPREQVPRISAASPQAVESAPAAALPTANSTTTPDAAAPRSDVQDAVSFALRRVGPKAKAGAVALICEGESNVLAACDRATCRRIAYAVLDAAVGQSGRGEAVAVEARNLRGAILLRVSLPSTQEVPADALRQAPGFAALAFTIDEAGGTMMFDSTAAGTTISVRLASAAP